MAGGRRDLGSPWPAFHSHRRGGCVHRAGSFFSKACWRGGVRGLRWTDFFRFLLHNGEGARDFGFELIEIEREHRLLRIEDEVERILKLAKVATNGLAHTP